MRNESTKNNPSPSTIRRRSTAPGSADVVADVARRKLRRKEGNSIPFVAIDDMARRRFTECENASVGYFVTDPYGKILDADALVAEVFQVDNGRLVGKRVINYVVRSSRTAFGAMLQALRATDAGPIAGTLVMRPRKSAPVVCIEMEAVASGGPSHHVGVHWFMRSVRPLVVEMPSDAPATPRTTGVAAPEASSPAPAE